MIDLEGKVALVTGGGRGIGAAIAKGLVAVNADVIVLDLPERHEARQILTELGPERCHLVTGDLAKLEDVPRLWQESLAWRGRIDILINNAGVYEQAPVDAEFRAWHDSWTRTLAINLISAGHLCREAIRHFAARDGGSIVNIASRASFRGDTIDYMNYAAAKGGMVSLTRTIARGFASKNILAYAVAPGFVRTELNREFFDTHGEEAVTRDIPLGEMAMPDDIARVVVFLASGLARHATGATLDINGASYVH